VLSILAPAHPDATLTIVYSHHPSPWRSSDRLSPALPVEEDGLSVRQIENQNGPFQLGFRLAGGG
jgi:hypothetical protein